MNLQMFFFRGRGSVAVKARSLSARIQLRQQENSSPSPAAPPPLVSRLWRTWLLDGQHRQRRQLGNRGI